MAIRTPILITGGRGMLAHAVGRELAGRGYAAHAYDADTCDITDPAAVMALFERYRPGVLINCAAHTRVDQCELEPQRADAVNGHAVGHLAEAARRFDTKLVHISTDFVFDGAKRTPYRPDDVPNPVNAYGRSKLLGERLLQEVNPPNWLIVRTAWLFGPNGYCFPQKILTATRAGRPLRVVADQTGAPTFTCDLAAILIDLVEREASGIWHATNAGPTTWFDFSLAILDTFGIAVDVTPISAAELKAERPLSAIRPTYSVLDTSATERTIGRPVRHWASVLEAYRAAVEAAGQ